MTENLRLVLALNIPVSASYNDGSIFIYTPTSEAMNGNTVTPRISSDEWNGYYYYNWYAATGEKGSSSSMGDVDGSICPKGWKLPYNYTVNPNVSWGGLTNTYGVTVNGTNTNTDTGYLILQASPLSIPIVGYYYNGKLIYGDTDASLWSSNGYDNKYAYYLYFISTRVHPQRWGDKSLAGMNVRCVASPVTE